MSEEFQSAIIKFDSANEIKVLKAGKALPVAHKKETIHGPQIKNAFTRVVQSFYEVNHQVKVDPKTKKRIVERETFTRFIQPSGGDKTAIFTTKEIFFVPMEIKFGRIYYEGAYTEGERKAPDCQSVNGIVPQTAKFASSCEECQFSKWDGSKPPKCGEVPEFLALDMTAKSISDAEVASAVTVEPVTLAFRKSAIKPIKDLMKQLAEPVLFEDGTYGQIDMTQYLVKATLNVELSESGQEKNYCIPEFEIVGRVPFEISEKLLEALNKPIPNRGNKTLLELFIGNTEPLSVGESDNKTAVVEASAKRVAVNETKEEEEEKPSKVAVKKATPVKATVVDEDDDEENEKQPFKNEEKRQDASSIPYTKVSVADMEDDEVVF